MNLSLRVLESVEIREQILKDIDELLDIAGKKQMKPVILVIGKLFIDVGIMKLLKDTLVPMVVKDEIEKDSQTISYLFKTKKLSAYNSYEAKSGDFSSEEEKRFKVFFDPEEEYMCLIVADPHTKAKEEESQTADNHPYYFLKFKKEEILANFCDKFIN
jgi:hypothetical protein